MVPENKRYTVAIGKFLESNPEIQAKLNALDPVVATHLGITLDDYREKELAQYFSSYVKSIGKDVSTLIIDLSATSEKEKTEMLIDRHKGIADALGMEWSEYNARNKIEA